ncbi:MAG: AAA family ATPase [Armatimonadetes bacterium]|nr:AAA family ATPase [Armatimonadota bacterium]
MVITQFFKENPVLMAGVAAAIGAFWRQLKESATDLTERIFSVSMRVDSGQAAFRWLELWMSKHKDIKKVRTTHARTLDSYPEHETPFEKVIALTPGEGLHAFKFRGKRVIMYKHVKESERSHKVRVSYHLYMFGRKHDLLKEILREALELHLVENERGIQLRTAGCEGWDYQESLPERSAASVVLPEGVMESLIEDLRGFFSAGQWYANLSIPHRRGVLLHGPPGSGKTSTILAVASELKCQLYWIPISATWLSDAVLMKLLMEIPRKSILVLEDIDAAFVGRKRGESGNKNLTFSGLLNALDGVCSSQGRVVFMTTNHPEQLDPALIRPGRIDLRIEIGYPSAYQRATLFERFFPGDGRGSQFASLVPDDVGMSALQEHLLSHRTCADSAIASAAERWERTPELELCQA